MGIPAGLTVPGRPAPRTADRLRARGGLLGWGDSEMGGSGPGSGNRYFDLALALLNQRPRNAGNYGIGGQTIATLSPVLEANVLSRNPGMVLVQMATNDLGNGRTAAQIVPDYAAEIARMRNRGIEPIVSAVPPRSGTAAITREGMRLNAALRSFAAREGLIFVNPWKDMRDPSTNAWFTGLSDDGIHPNWTGCKQAAANVAAQLGAFLLPGGVYLADAGDATYDVSLIADADFKGAATSGRSNAWTVSQSGGTVTFSQSADGSTPRNWQKVSVSSAPTSFSISQAINSANWSVGDELELSVRMRASGYVQATDLGRFYVRLDFTGGVQTTAYLYSQLPADFAEGTWTVRAKVPTGTTALAVRIGWQSGVFDLEIAQPTLVNRTREALA